MKSKEGIDPTTILVIMELVSTLLEKCRENRDPEKVNRTVLRKGPLARRAFEEGMRERGIRGRERRKALREYRSMSAEELREVVAEAE